MNIISIQNISHLDDDEIYISSCYSNGKVLTWKDKTISFESIHPQKNQKWQLLMENDKVYLKNKMGFICYFPEKNTDITIINDIENSIPECTWSIGKNGELYQTVSDAEERYLWVADDNLRVVSDGYLADSWKIQDDLKKNMHRSPLNDSTKLFRMLLGFVTIIGICIIYFLIMRK